MMGRWEPDAARRLSVAALELYTERGFDQTSVSEIAQRAGVTERTFFRYFADKREVLFGTSTALQDAVVAAVADSEGTAMEAVEAGIQAAAGMLGQDPAWARARAAIISSTPSLLERELLKMSTLAGAVAEALEARGIPATTARLAATTGTTVFGLAFDAWVSGDGDVAVIVRQHFEAQAALR